MDTGRVKYSLFQHEYSRLCDLCHTFFIYMARSAEATELPKTSARPFSAESPCYISIVITFFLLAWQSINENFILLLIFRNHECFHFFHVAFIRSSKKNVSFARINCQIPLKAPPPFKRHKSIFLVDSIFASPENAILKQNHRSQNLRFA